MEKSYLIPDIVLIGYGKTQSYQIRCIKCKTQFFPDETPSLFCEDCDEVLSLVQKQKYYKQRHFSPVPVMGNIVDWENRVERTLKRSTANYNKVYKRDEHTCQYCGYSPRTHPDFFPLWIDHIIPHSYGGGHKMENLVVACQPCNNIASNLVFDNFAQKKEYILRKRIEKGIDQPGKKEMGNQ